MILVASPQSPTGKADTGPVLLQGEDQHAMLQALDKLVVGSSANLDAAARVATVDLQKIARTKHANVQLVLLLADQGTIPDAEVGAVIFDRFEARCRRRLQEAVADAQATLSQVVLINVGRKGPLLSSNSDIELRYQGDANAVVQGAIHLLHGAPALTAAAAQQNSAWAQQENDPHQALDSSARVLAPLSGSVEVALQEIAAEQQVMLAKRQTLVRYAQEHGFDTSRAEAFGTFYERDPYGQARAALMAGHWEQAALALQDLRTPAAKAILARWSMQDDVRPILFSEAQQQTLEQAYRLQKESILSRRGACARHCALRQLADQMEQDAVVNFDDLPQRGPKLTRQALAALAEASLARGGLAACADAGWYRPDFEGLQHSSHRITAFMASNFTHLDNDFRCPRSELQGLQRSSNCIDLKLFVKAWKETFFPREDACGCATLAGRARAALGVFPPLNNFCADNPEVLKDAGAAMDILMSLKDYGGMEAARRLRLRLPKAGVPTDRKRAP